MCVYSTDVYASLERERTPRSDRRGRVARVRVKKSNQRVSSVHPRARAFPPDGDGDGDVKVSSTNARRRRGHRFDRRGGTDGDGGRESDDEDDDVQTPRVDGGWRGSG